MAAADLQKRWGLIVGLRALIMLLAGFYAVIWPGPALAALVVIGGGVMLVDGVLGLWALTFGGAKTGNFWFDVIRNVLGIICGVIILLFPLLSTLITVWFVVYLIAIQAIIVGAMEIVIADERLPAPVDEKRVLDHGAAILRLGNRRRVANRGIAQVAAAIVAQ